MNSTVNTLTRGAGDLAVILAAGLGLLFVGYGALVLPGSLLGGAWLAAIGVSFVLAAVLTTGWSGERLGLSAARRRSLSLAFAGLALVLLAAFVAINYVSFESGFVESGSSSGGN